MVSVPNKLVVGGHIVGVVHPLQHHRGGIFVVGKEEGTVGGLGGVQGGGASDGRSPRQTGTDRGFRISRGEENDGDSSLPGDAPGG